MGQKINPISLRLHYTNRHFDSCWYSNYFYKNLIIKDIFLQQYLNNFFKLLKLPTSRYSIHHLQKKTQVYNFLCYPKSTREWRSKVFGLKKKKNFLKKTRYFFKTKQEFKKNFKKHTKLNTFYTTLNQLAIHKIQKKITSFQNFQLWSTLIKKSSNYKKPNWNKMFLTTNFSNNLIQKNQNFQIMSSFNVFEILLSNTLKNSNIYISNCKQQKKSILIQKISKQPNTPKNLELLFRKPLDNSYLAFLQNLLIYKILKSNLKIKNQTIFSDKTKDLKYQSFKNSFFKTKKPQNLGLMPFGFNSLEFKYKNYLESSLSKLYHLETEIIPFKVKNDWQHANYLADEIVYFLEKRVTFRRLKSKILRQLSQIPEIRGVRITCAGRVGGKSKKAQRAKTECIKYGQTSLQVFSSKIDFSVKTAFTSFGSVGVKVWICYN